MHEQSRELFFLQSQSQSRWQQELDHHRHHAQCEQVTRPSELHTQSHLSPLATCSPISESTLTSSAKVFAPPHEEEEIRKENEETLEERNQHEHAMWFNLMEVWSTNYQSTIIRQLHFWYALENRKRTEKKRSHALIPILSKKCPPPRHTPRTF
jgi:hypothetical protein